MADIFKAALDSGAVDQIRALLQSTPAYATRLIRWGGLTSACTSEPLHYVSDAPFNQLWTHGRQAALAEALVDGGAPVDGLPTSGETPLHGAASLGEAGVAEVLIARGADLERVARYPGTPDGTPLDFAVHFGMVDVVDLLVRQGARVRSARMAAGAGQLESLKTRLRSSPLVPPDRALLDVFRCAVVCDRVEVVEYCLATGISVNAIIAGATALHWAAWEAKPRVVELLLSRGADPAIRDGEHHATPVEWAEHRQRQLGPRWNHASVIRLLKTAARDSS